MSTNSLSIPDNQETNSSDSSCWKSIWHVTMTCLLILQSIANISFWIYIHSLDLIRGRNDDLDISRVLVLTWDAMPVLPLFVLAIQVNHSRLSAPPSIFDPSIFHICSMFYAGVLGVTSMIFATPVIQWNEHGEVYWHLGWEDRRLEYLIRGWVGVQFTMFVSLFSLAVMLVLQRKRQKELEGKDSRKSQMADHQEEKDIEAFPIY